MTSATEVLRRLLDEHGVEHYDGTECTLWGYEPTGNGTGVYHYAADEIDSDRMTMRLYHVTPEQAIAATLGSCNCSNNCTNGERTGTCHMEQTGHVKVAGVDYYDDDYECSECGAEIFEGYNFCPMCGRRIEQ